jgi:hypothetical protein
MANKPAATGSKGPSAEDRIRAIVREVLGDADRKRARDGESKEQAWIRQVIGEELDSRFEAFAAGLLEDEDEPKGKGGRRSSSDDEAGDDEAGGFIARLFSASEGGGR